MGSRTKTRTIVVRRRNRNGSGLLNGIARTITSATARPIGLIMLLVAIAFTINYNSDTTHKVNWISTWATKLQAKATWKWLGDYLAGKSLQFVHSLWLSTAAFLGARPALAFIVSIIAFIITLSLQAATTLDITLQALFLFFLLAARNSAIRVIAIILFILAIIFGHTLQQLDF